MLTYEEKLRVADYFEPWDLVSYLQVSTREVIDAFEDELEDVLEQLYEVMGLSGDNDNEPED